MVRIALIGLGLAALIACGPPPPPSAAMLERQSPIMLCQNYSAARTNGFAASRQAILAEIDRRQLLSAQERQQVLLGQMRLGMRELVAVCSWGPYYDVNTTTTSAGVNKQIVMGPFGPYVYTENGRVTGWQN